MSTPSAKAVVLLIDDEPSVLVALTAALSTMGYDCHTSQDAQSAYVTARVLAPDLIISDINLGGESGLALCERIKQVTALQETPVIFLSGAEIPDVVRRAKLVGGTYYLRKPFDTEVLLELVEKALWMPHLVQHQLQSS
jgi:DNA-binding response OmpR family regulator